MAGCGGQGTILGDLKDLVHQVGTSGCSNSGVMGDLKDLVNQVGGSCEPPPPCAPRCCPPMSQPYAQVTITCPPPILAPTRPEPVEPLRLPCPVAPCDNEMSEYEAEMTRYDNFYNNYNIEWRNDGTWFKPPNPCLKKPCPPQRARGQTVDGKSPCCDEALKGNGSCPLPGCPTGFKPCAMKLCPPPCCDPNGVWAAQVQPCPPGSKKKRR